MNVTPGLPLARTSPDHGTGVNLAGKIAQPSGAGLRVSLFIDPDERQTMTAAQLHAPVVELHTGAYARATASTRGAQLIRSNKAAAATGAMRLNAMRATG